MTDQKGDRKALKLRWNNDGGGGGGEDELPSDQKEKVRKRVEPAEEEEYEDDWEDEEGEWQELGDLVVGMVTKAANTREELRKLVTESLAHRKTRETSMNTQSSRSHTILTISITSSGEQYNWQRSGKLNLVDLAGSEKLSKSKVSGEGRLEAVRVNQSLSSLGGVINALVEGSKHIPYRGSKLTRLLQDSLGGNTKTVLIANIGPADYNCDETLRTLIAYASKAKRIQNNPRINDGRKAMLNFCGSIFSPIDGKEIAFASLHSDQRARLLTDFRVQLPCHMWPTMLKGLTWKGLKKLEERIKTEVDKGFFNHSQAINAHVTVPPGHYSDLTTEHVVHMWVKAVSGDKVTLKSTA